MKKSFIVLLCLFTFYAPVSAAYYKATVDVNVRNNPNISALRIGHFKKGQTVNVKRVLGKKWCHIQYRKYNNAYVYCPLLKKIVNQKTKPQAAPVRLMTFDEIFLNYPGDWKNFRTDRMMYFFQADNAHPGSASVVVVTRIEKENETRALEHAHQMLIFLENSVSKTAIKKVPIKIMVGGQAIDSVLLRIKTDTSESFYTSVAKGNNAYLIAGTVIPPDEVKAKVVEDIVRSFQVK